MFQHFALQVVRTIARWMAKRPYVGAAVLGALSLGATVLFLTGGRHAIGAGITIALWLGTVGLALTGRSMQRHAALVDEARSAGGVVPPPQRINVDGFWFWLAATITVLAFGIGGFVSEFVLDDGRRDADGIVVDATFSHRNLDNEFYDITVAFTTDAGEPVIASYKKFGSARIGRTVQVSYDPDAPAIDLDEAAGPALIGVAVSAVLVVGSLAGTFAFIGRPRRTDPGLTLVRIAGFQGWTRHVVRISDDNSESHYVLHSDGRLLRMWGTNRWAADRLVEWLESGGIPSEQAVSHSDHLIDALELVAAHGTSLQLTGPDRNGKRHITEITLGEQAENVLNDLAYFNGWQMGERMVRPGSTRLGPYLEPLFLTVMGAYLLSCLGVILVEPETPQIWTAMFAATIGGPALIGAIYSVLSVRPRVRALVTGPAWASPHQPALQRDPRSIGSAGEAAMDSVLAAPYQRAR